MRAKFLDPSKLKAVFNKMTEVESDPNSKRAQEYYKQLEETEKANKKKRNSQILIKTMKRGRVTGESSVEVDQYGRPLDEKQIQFNKKNQPFVGWKWPEVNAVEYKRKDLHSNSMLKIQNYRWPAIGERRGVV